MSNHLIYVSVKNSLFSFNLSLNIQVPPSLPFRRLVFTQHWKSLCCYLALLAKVSSVKYLWMCIKHSERRSHTHWEHQLKSKKGCSLSHGLIILDTDNLMQIFYRHREVFWLPKEHQQNYTEMMRCFPLTCKNRSYLSLITCPHLTLSVFCLSLTHSHPAILSIRA